MILNTYNIFIAFTGYIQVDPFLAAKKIGDALNQVNRFAWFSSLEELDENNVNKYEDYGAITVKGFRSKADAEKVQNLLENILLQLKCKPIHGQECDVLEHQYGLVCRCMTASRSQPGMDE